MAVSANISLPRILPVFSSAARVPHNLFGNTDEHAICRGLLLVALPRGHPLDRLHPTPRRTPAIAKPLDSSQFQCFGQAPNQARDAPHPTTTYYRSDDGCRSAPPW